MKIKYQAVGYTKFHQPVLYNFPKDTKEEAIDDTAATLKAMANGFEEKNAYVLIHERYQEGEE